MRPSIFCPGLMTPPTTTMPRSDGSLFAMDISMRRWRGSVVTTRASASFSMYATSSSCSFGSIGTTDAPVPAWARYDSIHSGPLPRMIAAFSSPGFSPKRTP